MEEIQQELDEYKKREQERTLLSEEEKEIQLDVEAEYLHDTEAFVEDYEEYPEDYHEDHGKLCDDVEYPVFPTAKKENPTSDKAGNMKTVQGNSEGGITSYNSFCSWSCFRHCIISSLFLFHRQKTENESCYQKNFAIY